MGTLIVRMAGGVLAIRTTDADPGPDPSELNATHNLTAGWATFGQVVPQGAVPAGQAIQVGSLATQCDIKTTWIDGSARFIVLSCVVPETGDYSLSVVAAGSGSFAPTIPTASVVFTIGGVAWTATLPGTVSADLWLDGAQAKEWRHVVAPLNPSSTPHVSLRVIFDARVYSDDSARIDVAVENGFDAPTTATVDYDVAVTIAGDSAFTASGISHWPGTRWRKVAGAGLAASSVTLDWEPAHVAGALPRWRSTIANADYGGAMTGPAWEILQRGGSAYDYMPSTGERDEIAPYPAWAARAVVFGNQDQYAYTLANGDFAGSWPIHFRETDGSLISIDDRPNFWLDSRGADRLSIDYDDPSIYSPLTPDLSHAPSFAYVPYLMSGDRYYADEMADWANFALLGTYQDTVDNFGRGGATGIVGVEQVRGRAWSLRNLTDAAAYLPDSHPMRAYFAEKVTNNLDYYTNDSTPTNWPIVSPIGAPLDRPQQTGNPAGSYELSLWQNDYLAWALDHANRQGFPGGTGTRGECVAFQLKLFTSSPDYPREYAGPYWPIVARLVDGELVYYATLAEFWDANFDPPLRETFSDLSYVPECHMGLLLAIRDGREGAQEAHDWLLGQPGVIARLDGAAGKALDFPQEGDA